MLKAITPQLTSDIEERIALRRIRTLLSLVIMEQRRKLVLPRITMRCWLMGLSVVGMISGES